MATKTLTTAVTFLSSVSLISAGAEKATAQVLSPLEPQIEPQSTALDLTSEIAAGDSQIPDISTLLAANGESERPDLGTLLAGIDRPEAPTLSSLMAGINREAPAHLTTTPTAYLVTDSEIDSETDSAADPIAYPPAYAAINLASAATSETLEQPYTSAALNSQTADLTPQSVAYNGLDHSLDHSLDNPSGAAENAFSSQSADITAPLLALGNDTTWNTNAVDRRGKLDLDFVYECPANGTLGPVWGSGIYSDESSVCSAAVHAGVITPQEGGTVTIRTRPGQTAYASGERNGVSAEEAGSGQGSFIFLSSAMPVSGPIDWAFGAADLRGRLDQSFTFTCLPNGKINNVWGSDLYTDDSSVCSAAVHAGLINTRDGGTVSIRMMPGQGAYTSTSRNGVTTIGYGNWHGSYIFLR